MFGVVRVIAGAAVAVAIVSLAGTAQAGFQICNSSSGDVVTAFGYREDGVWTSAGWWSIAKGECAIVYDRNLKDQYYYYYAEEINGGGRWEGSYVFCAVNEAFTIAGDENCNARGYDKYGFLEVDVGERINYSIELTD